MPRTRTAKNAKTVLGWSPLRAEPGAPISQPAGSALQDLPSEPALQDLPPPPPPPLPLPPPVRVYPRSHAERRRAFQPPQYRPSPLTDPLHALAHHAQSHAAMPAARTRLIAEEDEAAITAATRLRYLQLLAAISLLSSLAVLLAYGLVGD